MLAVLFLALSVTTPASSVFVIIPGMLQTAGSGALWAMIISALVLVATAFIYAELSSAWPIAGGEYVMVARTMGPAAGFAILGVSVVNNVLFPPVAGLGISAVLAVVIPGLPEVPVAIAIVALATLCGLLNIRVNAWITGIFLAIEIVALAVVAALVFAGPMRPLPALLLDPVMPTPGGLEPATPAAIGLATTIGIFALNGCKPTIASILASQHNAYVLDAGRGTLQDTNDRALANMQKDGTYSVVPRIAGGEITPKKLGVIAAVAEKYNLYTKITGGQRIDMFGARLEQLPEIWKELVDAGFESGQAYGKSLRTVKSCVGSTWCRFGVQDSVAMAIQLELRYRGLRSPHKLKMGVSGCARECAEARGKDVGVIATADGWNLYVGGNGGATPAHAQLLAKDLDDETLLKYIDRYFMYYIRTADRLQRTARWQEELDGGIKHVEDVVVKDTLGIAEELEAAMAKHVDTYVDEWADTLKDPERLRRFRSFVNAPDQKDDSITFVPDERGQFRPATAEEKGKVLIGASIPVRSSTPDLLDENEV